MFPEIKRYIYGTGISVWNGCAGKGMTRYSNGGYDCAMNVSDGAAITKTQACGLRGKPNAPRPLEHCFGNDVHGSESASGNI